MHLVTHIPWVTILPTARQYWIACENPTRHSSLGKPFGISLMDFAMFTTGYPFQQKRVSDQPYKIKVKPHVTDTLQSCG